MRDIINKNRKAVENYNDMDFSTLWTSSYKVTGSGFPTTFSNGSYGNAYGTVMRSVYPGFTF